MTQISSPPPVAEGLTRADDRVLAGVQKLRFFPLEIVAGRGCLLESSDGRELLDLSASWTAAGLGYGHPAVVEAVTRAIATAAGAGACSAISPDAVGLAEDLLDLVPGANDRRVYLGLAGSDANDVALRCVRHATGRSRIVAFEHGYHGGLGLAMNVSGVHLDNGMPAAEGLTLLPYPNPFRPHTGEIVSAIGDILAKADQALAGAACLIVEPILSDGGFVIPPDGFLASLHEICRRHGVPLICDEVKVGLGRTGLLHAFDHDKVTPDIVTFGKMLGGGLPLSAAVGPAEILDRPVGSAVLTTAGNPVTAAVGRAVLATIRRDGLVERAAIAGRRLMEGLRSLKSHTSFGARLGDIRGRGCAIGIELVDESGVADAQLAHNVVYRAWQLGVVLYVVGESVLEITPPLVISDLEIDRAVEVLCQAIDDAVQVS